MRTGKRHYKMMVSRADVCFANNSNEQANACKAFRQKQHSLWQIWWSRVADLWKVEMGVTVVCCRC